MQAMNRGMGAGGGRGNRVLTSQSSAYMDGLNGGIETVWTREAWMDARDGMHVETG